MNRSTRKGQFLKAQVVSKNTAALEGLPLLMANPQVASPLLSMIFTGGCMAKSVALVEALKRELRARKITYAAVARHLGLSEVSVKRMFSRHELSLARIDGICELAGLEFSDVARSLAPQGAVLSQLTQQQEKEFVADQRLMLVALSALNNWSFEQIVRGYDLSEAECVKLLMRLDRLKFIELLPHNRVRLLVNRAFTWIPGGPIQEFFKSQAQLDFFQANFDREGELMLLANGALSPRSIATLLARLKQLAGDFAEMRIDDAHLPGGERRPITLLLATRPWEPRVLSRFRRKPAKAVKPERAAPGGRSRAIA